MKKLLLLITILTGLSAVASAQVFRITERQWKLTSLEGASVTRGSNAYLEINSVQTRFTGNAGCNRMFGSVEIRGRQISFSGVGTTKMACVDARTRRTETAFLSALARAERFRETGNSLEIYDRRRVIMRFDALKKQPEESVDSVGLEDKKWTLDSINGVTVPEIGRNAFIVFDKAKGTAGGNSGCNVFGGSYTAAGSTVKVTEVIATMRACIEDERMKIERQFLDGLEKTNRYEIQGGKLMLYQNKRLLLTLTGEAK